MVQKDGSTIHLPLDSYELPIQETCIRSEASSELVTLKTDRATYILKKS
ncbi:hypothetical protein KHA80_20720 [Anaerobacillus sp. HL2]|nr:hypothetical protein KHA80_20720 [Anaerobacillus sp. HL2]